MKFFSRRLFGLALILSTTLTACGGSSHNVLPVTHAASGHQTGQVNVTVHVPARQKQTANQIAYAKSQLAAHSNNRKPQYFSGATTQMNFTLESNNGTPVSAADQAAFDFTIYLQDSSQCTPDGSGGYNCTVNEPAPVGTDTYNVTSYECSVSGSSSTSSCQSLGGTLTMLSAAYTSVNVQYNKSTVMAFTLSAVVASIDWAPVAYAKQSGYGSLPSTLWLTQPNGSNIPKYTPASSGPGSYSCTYNAGSGTGNGCYEPVAQGTAIAYGETLEVRDPTGAIIIGAANNGTIYQTPVYLDTNGNAVTINWHCTDNAGGSSLTFETGAGPYTSNAQATAANNAFNSPVTNPAADPDGGNTTDANGHPVTAVGNNGAEINWDGADQPVLDKPDFCTATTSNGLSTPLNFYAGLGEGGVTPLPAATFGPGLYIASSVLGTNTPPPNPNSIVYHASQGSLTTSSANPYTTGPNAYFSIRTTASAVSMAVNRYGGGGTAGTVLWGAFPKDGPSLQKFVVGQSGPVATISLAAGSNPTSVAVDSAGNVYELDTTCSCINVYASTASGSASPIRTISPAQLGARIFIDQNDNLWTSDKNSYTYEYPSSASGSVSPTITVTAPCFATEPDASLVCGAYNTTKGRFTGVTIMSAANGYNSPVFTYPISNLNAFGGFNQPSMATDSNGFIYVPSGEYGSTISPAMITIYEPYSAGISAPYATITGSNDGADYATSVAVLGNATAPASGFSEYSVPTSNANPYAITVGPDGALWFTESLANKIGRITTSGQITEYPIPTANSSPQGISVGPNGNIWFTERDGNKIGQITPSGSITEYSLPNALSAPIAIAEDANGYLWFTETANRLGQIDMFGNISEYPVTTTAQQPNGIASGPAGSQTLWFTGANACEVSKFDRMTDAISNYPYPCSGTGSGMAGGITAGPDGALWFTGTGGLPNTIGRMTTSGSATQFTLPSETDPNQIAQGPDGALWFTESYTDSIGRITTAGAFSHFTIPTASSAPGGIVTGPDGAIWFTEMNADKIGRYHP